MQPHHLSPSPKRDILCAGTATIADAQDAPKDEHDAVTSVPLTGGLESAFSPQFAPVNGQREGDGRLLFLSQDAACHTGTHDGTVALHSLPWPAEVRFRFVPFGRR